MRTLTARATTRPITTTVACTTIADLAHGTNGITSVGLKAVVALAGESTFAASQQRSSARIDSPCRCRGCRRSRSPLSVNPASIAEPDTEGLRRLLRWPSFTDDTDEHPADETHGMPPRHLDNRGPAVSAEPSAIACSTPYQNRSLVEPFGPGSRTGDWPSHSARRPRRWPGRTRARLSRRHRVGMSGAPTRPTRNRPARRRQSIQTVIAYVACSPAITATAMT